MVRIKEALKSKIQRYGWKFGLVVIAYYLIRDITLYIVIPYWILR